MHTRYALRIFRPVMQDAISSLAAMCCDEVPLQPFPGAGGFVL